MGKESFLHIICILSKVQSCVAILGKTRWYPPTLRQAHLVHTVSTCRTLFCVYTSAW